jgi:hypothetical protein
MNFEPYITYDEYVELGGKAPLDAFSIYERKSQRLLDYITFNRIPKLTKIPDEVKEVITEFIDRYFNFDTNVKNSDSNNLSQYSNGVETFTYRRQTESSLNSDLYNLAISWLPDYLTCRSVNFDIEQYLQSNSDNS